MSKKPKKISLYKTVEDERSKKGKYSISFTKEKKLQERQE